MFYVFVIHSRIGVNESRLVAFLYIGDCTDCLHYKAAKQACDDNKFAMHFVL